MIFKDKQKAIDKLKSGTHFSSNLFNNFRDDEEVLKVAMSQSKIHYAFQFASDRLKDNDEIAMLAINDKTNFKYVSDRLKSNKEFVMEAIKKGCSLVWADKNLQNNKEIVLEAVKQDKFAIRFASKEIQDLCKNKDPIQTLEKAIDNEKIIELYNKLEKTLSIKSDKKTTLKI